MSAPALVSDRSRFRESIVAWSAELLSPYVSQLEQQLESRRRDEKKGRTLRSARTKEFNDAVWRTIVLEPFEVLVIDSPLLQRLRRIRQLGVVDLVYPSAVHTRFEHTLGAVLQVSRLVDALLNELPPNRPDINVQWRNLLRLAAIAHDVGHGAMSHVSENALRNFTDVENIRLEFTDEVDFSEPSSLSEIAAHDIVGGDPFRALIDVVRALVPTHALPDNPTKLIQHAVVGLPIRDDIPLLHELISGPFDGDKLDYMTRDAQMTGVPVVTDIHRLVQKVRSLRVAEDRLPDEVARQVVGGQPNYTLTGVALSGGRTLDELLIGKTLLFDKLYRHQKVRAAECMIAAIFQQLGERCSGGPAIMAYRLVDDDFLHIDERTIRALEVSVAHEGDVEFDIARDLSTRLAERRLFVRSYAFAQNMPLDPYSSEREHWRGLTALRLAAKAPDSRGKLVGEIAAEIHAVLAALGKEALLDQLPHRELEPYLWIDPPQPPEEGDDIARAYLIGDNGEWLRFKDDYAEAIGWSAAYPLTRDLGYLFTVAELAPFAFIAMEKVVRERYEVKTPASMIPYAKQFEPAITGLKRALASEGYYDSSPHDLRPTPERLTKADVGPRVARVVSRLQGYEGPVRAGHAGKQTSLMNGARALNWVRQFMTDDLAAGALRAIEHIEILGRRELAQTFGRFLANHAEFHNGSLVPLGEPKDSSAVLTYYAGDVGSAYGLVGRTLGDALAAGGPIVFVDDFIGSGAQAVSIIENWLDERTVDLKEARGAPLPEQLREALTSTPLGFAFTAGTRDGAARVQSRADGLSLRAVVDVGVTDLPTVFSEEVFENQRQGELFIERCREIGRELLLDPAGGHDEKWAEERALGYGNFGYLVVFPYNSQLRP